MPRARDFRRRLWEAHEGVLRIGERAEDVRFVLDPASGQPVLPVPTDVVVGGEAVALLTPQDTDDALQVLATPVEVDPRRHEACDRYLIHFGRAEHPRWALLEIESVKRLDEVLDGAEVVGESPLRGVEAELCRALNASPGRLAAACEASARVRIESPRAVAVDEFGVTVRARFGVVRIAFAREASDADAARALVARLLAPP
jgi:hypothetical protein